MKKTKEKSASYHKILGSFYTLLGQVIDQLFISNLFISLFLTLVMSYRNHSICLQNEI